MYARRNSGYATASMVLGLSGIFLACFLFVPNILAVVFGHLALRQIKRTGQQGKGMAITGIILGYGVIAASVAVALVAPRI